MEPQDFLSNIWSRQTTYDGKTLPLPELWRVKVEAIPATEEDWLFALQKAAEASERDWKPIKADAVFNYATTIVWRRIGERSPLDTRRLDPFVVDHAAAMKADADAIAAEVAWQEQQEHEERARAERRSKYQAEYEEWRSEALSQPLVRRPMNQRERDNKAIGYDVTLPNVHRVGGCSRSKADNLEPFDWPEDDIGEDGKEPGLCSHCFPTRPKHAYDFAFDVPSRRRR